MSASWRDRILAELVPGTARLTLVADPDDLLLEDILQQSIREKGFDLISFDDHVAFRLSYESNYRSLWDRGETPDKAVVLRARTRDLSILPYDILQAGRPLSFGLADLFPILSYPVIAALDRADLDALYHAQHQHPPEGSGDSATRDYILLHLYGIVPELAKQPSDLLRVLLRKHYGGRLLPAMLDEQFALRLQQSGRFDDWPLESIVPDRTAFFAFLQERWPIFVERLAREQGLQVHEPGVAYPMQYGGPTDIPFEHDDIRVYVDNLFLDGLLRPVAHERASSLSKGWAVVGLVTDPKADLARRLDRLGRAIDASVPAGPDATHQEWVAFALRWAEFIVLRHAADTSKHEGLGVRLTALREKVDSAFGAWLLSRYGGLHNRPPVPPAMVHHIPRMLARQLSLSPGYRVALVVIDGLALDQWVVLREVLFTQQPDLKPREGATFAWMPTVTSVSRQALFAGKPPMYFASSIQTSEKERQLWTAFWAGQGLIASEVGYIKGLGEEDSFSQVEVALSRPGVRALGLVVDKVDRIMHGMELGTAGMHNQVRQWAKHGFVRNLLDLLFARGFHVLLTSDHGNVEAIGCGKLDEGVNADVRGARVRIYSDQILRSQAKKQFPEAIECPSIGLPEDFLPLLAPGRSAFVPIGQRMVGHGGMTIEELIVPLIAMEATGT